VNGDGESYCGIVPTKQPNKSDESPAEVVEGRPQTKENTQQSHPCRTPSRETGSSGLERVREAARKDGKLKFTALLHHVSIDLLRSSYYSLKKQAAPGVDGMTWEEYGRDLEERLADLHGRIHRGAYRAQPSRRVWVPKADGRQRPLGIAALEDKIVQYAVGTVLNQIWEEDFLGFSYGFRPERSQQDALDALWVGIVRKNVNWILDLDIRSFLERAFNASVIRMRQGAHGVICSPAIKPSLTQRCSVDGAIPRISAASRIVTSGESITGGGLTALAVENPRDDIIRVVHSQAANQIEGILLGPNPRRGTPRQGDLDRRDRRPPPA